MTAALRQRLFLSVRDQLLVQIKEQYATGQQLPSEAELAGQLEVSRVTLREALQALEEDGIVERRQGVGTFVKADTPLLTSRLDLNYGVGDVVRQNGMEPGAREVRIETVVADALVAEKLALAEGERVLRFERVRTANGKAVVFSTDFIPVRLVPNSTGFDPVRGSLYGFLENDCAVAITFGVARLAPVKAGASIARKLDVHPNSLLLLVEQVDYAGSDAPVVYSREYHLKQAFQFTVLRRLAPPAGDTANATSFASIDRASLRSIDFLP